MTNNDILRRVRYILNYDDTKMMEVFGLAGQQVSLAQVADLLSKDDDPSSERCADPLLAVFLNGLINTMRGKRDGAQPEPEERLTNNLIFVKLKIAFDLKAEDVLGILELADVYISKHELSAFFRRPGHKHFRECKDQILRNFLMGLQLRYRGKGETGA